MNEYISEMMTNINKAQNRKEKKGLLEKYSTNTTFKLVLQGTFDPSIEWIFDKKTKFPKYQPSNKPLDLSESSLFTVVPKCSIFVKGHPKSSGLTSKRTKELLIQILEQLHKNEGDIFTQMLKKKLKVKGLTEKLVLEVFPDLYRKVDK